MQWKGLVNSVVDNYMIAFRVRTSIAERLPQVEMIVDNSNNKAEADDLYDFYDDLEIQVGEASLNTVFKGYIENFRKSHEGQEQIVLTGRGYALLLQEQMIDIFIQTTKYPYEIVINLVNEYGRDGSGIQQITTTNVYQDTSVDQISKTFKGISAWDAIMQICLEYGYDAWVDETKDLHFVPRQWEDSGVTIDDTHRVYTATKKEKGEQTINRVIVYGDPNASPSQPVGRADDYGSQKTSMGIVKTKIVVNTEITIQADAERIAYAELTRLKNPAREIKLTGVGWENVNVGQLVRVDLPFWGIDGTYYVLEREQTLPPDHTTLTLFAYAFELEDVIIEIIKDIRKQRQKDLADSITKKLLRFHEQIIITPIARIFRIGTGSTNYFMGYSNPTGLGYSQEYQLGYGGMAEEEEADLETGAWS